MSTNMQIGRRSEFHEQLRQARRCAVVSKQRKRPKLKHHITPRFSALVRLAFTISICCFTLSRPFSYLNKHLFTQWPPTPQSGDRRVFHREVFHPLTGSHQFQRGCFGHSLQPSGVTSIGPCRIRRELHPCLFGLPVTFSVGDRCPCDSFRAAHAGP